MSASRIGKFVSLLSLAALVTFEGSAVAEEFDRSQLIEGARKEGKLVWYTGAPDGLASRMLSVFNEKYPFIDVSEYYSSTAGRVMSKLQAEIEAGRKVADVFHTGDMGTVLTLHSQGDIAPFVTPEQDNYGDLYKEPGIWTGWRITTLNMGYNGTRIKAEDAPDSWTALTEPRFSGKLGFQDSTSGLQHLQWYILRQHMGKDFWKQVAQNEPVIYGGNVAIVEAVLRGELHLAGETTSYFIWKYTQSKKTPFKGVWPVEGVPLGVQPISVLKDAPHPNAARLFVDWVLSQEGQRVMVEAIGDYSARDDVDPPQGSPKLSALKTLLPDSYEGLLNSKEEFIEEWKMLAK
ncbi:extracellular solute-binding protein [Pelagibius sp. CAU 1746]|uniref:ABC transporter substrate-binding protein n=1 Tax=Pelagibius sp. CAU 1746 TaxID=3140370 RepID=UPI00325B8CFF